MDDIPELITETSDLQNAMKTLSEFNAIAVDTEFIRESTYYPKLCLVQLAAGEYHFAVDPLSESIELSSLFELLQNQNTTHVSTKKHVSFSDLDTIFEIPKE